MELEFGDDYTQTTGCVYPGLMGGDGGDCARAFLCVRSATDARALTPPLGS